MTYSDPTITYSSPLAYYDGVAVVYLAQVSWSAIVSNDYVYNVTKQPAPLTAIAIVRPEILTLWVYCLGSLPSDPYPLGTLALTVTPDTGVTISDNNFDGTGNSNHIGDGTAAENASSQAEAGFQVEFADAGTFVIGATYTSADGNYADATLANPLTVVVTGPGSTLIDGGDAAETGEALSGGSAASSPVGVIYGGSA